MTITNNLKRSWTQVGVFLITAAIIAAIVWLGYCIGSCSPIPGQIIMSIALLGLGWLILSTTHRLMMKNFYRLVTFLFLYALGIWAYESVGTENQMIHFFAPINHTLSIFFPSRGSYDGDLARNILFHIVHFLSYLFCAMILFSWFGKRIMNRSGYNLILWKHKNIFWGYSKGGILLANDILTSTFTQQVIFVLPNELKNNQEEEKRIFEEIDGMGAVALYLDFDSGKTLPKGHRHFFLTEDQDFNVRMAIKVSRLEQDRQRSIYVRTEIPQVWTLFDQNKRVELHLFNQSDLTARKFAKDHPLIECAETTGKDNSVQTVNNFKVDFNFNILLLGFGWTGRELLHKEICDSQFVGSHFTATIFDNDYEVKNGEYPILYNECIDTYNLSFNPDFARMLPIDRTRNIVGSQPFYEWLDAHMDNYNRIIVALGDDRLNLDTAATIAQIAQNRSALSPGKRIFAHVREPQRYSYCKSQVYPITLFGDLREIYTMDIVIDEGLDIMAKTVNYVYSRYDQQTVPQADIEQNAERVWKETSNLFHKDSSRAAAANIGNIIRLAGGENELTEALKEPNIVEILAETEHKRWNAFHFTKGVRKWDQVSENPKMGAKLFSDPANKNSTLLKHACLVEYKKLEEIAKLVNQVRKRNGNLEEENFQETDRRIIRHFPIVKHITKLKADTQ